MAVLDLPLTSLPEALSVNPADPLYVVQGGSSRRIEAGNLTGTGLALPSRVVDAHTSLVLTDGVLYCNPPVGGLTISLLELAITLNRVFYVSNLDQTGRLVTLQPDGAELIEDAVSFAVYPTEVVGVHATPGGWRVISE